MDTSRQLVALPSLSNDFRRHGLQALYHVRRQLADLHAMLLYQGLQCCGVLRGELIEQVGVHRTASSFQNGL